MFITQVIEILSYFDSGKMYSQKYITLLVVLYICGCIVLYHIHTLPQFENINFILNQMTIRLSMNFHYGENKLNKTYKKCCSCVG